MADKCGALRLIALSAVKPESTGAVAMIELIEVRLADLASEAELVCACSVRNDVGQMPSQVAAAFGIGDARLLETLDAKVWSSDDRLAMIRSVRTEV